ncbi:DUF3761 domain-containing protein [Kineococcus endophyticus]
MSWESMGNGSRTPARRSTGKTVALAACLGLAALVALVGVVSSFVVGGAASAAGSLLAVVGLTGLLVGLFTVVVGHFRTAGLAGRRAGAVLTVLSLVALSGGGALAGGDAPADTVATAATTPGATPTTTPAATPARTPVTTPDPVPTTTTTTTTRTSTTDAILATAAPGTALAALDTLDVKGRAPKTGYSRDAFGAAWTDTDQNGCYTRNDVLNRDLTARSWTDAVHCTVSAGALADPYSGDAIAFTRGGSTSSAVQVDHVVALSNAWQTGAQSWDAATRTAFANDPLGLLAVDGPLNEQKGDGDAATWLPPNTAFRCDYVARQVAVKAAYGLWVTPPERDAIARVLGTCPGEPLPVRSAFAALVAAPVPVPVPRPVVVAPAPATSAPAPAADAPAETSADVPAGASAVCRDGTLSYSAHRRGTCSHHGGVDTWL